MSYKFTKSEVYRTNYQVIKIGYPFEAQFLFREYQREGWNEGVQWNYDIYDINGKRFLFGNVESDVHLFSMKKLKELGLTAKNISSDLSGTKRKEAIDKLMEEFCSSIDKGIHDPSPILNFNQYKKNLYEQHIFFPEKPLLQIAQDLNKYIPSQIPANRGLSWKKVNAKEMVKEGLNKIINSVKESHKDNVLSDEDIMKETLQFCIDDFENKQRIKELKSASDFGLKCEILNHIKDDTIFDFVSNNAYRMDKAHLSDLWVEMNYSLTQIFPPESKEFKAIYSTMKENLIENCSYGETDTEKTILERIGEPSFADFIRGESYQYSKDMMKDLIKEFDYAVYSNTEGKLNKSARKDYIENLKNNLVEYRDYLDFKPKSKEINERSY